MDITNHMSSLQQGWNSAPIEQQVINDGLKESQNEIKKICPWCKTNQTKRQINDHVILFCKNGCFECHFICDFNGVIRRKNCHKGNCKYIL
jgi:hypothetical protein